MNRVDLLPMLLLVAVLLQGLLPVPPTVAASTVFVKDSEYENSKRHPLTYSVDIAPALPFCLFIDIV